MNVLLCSPWIQLQRAYGSRTVTARPCPTLKRTTSTGRQGGHRNRSLGRDPHWEATIPSVTVLYSTTIANHCLSASVSFPNKQKSADQSAAAMSSALGSNLSELDRLLLELNAVQQNSPSFPTTGTQTAKHILHHFLCYLSGTYLYHSLCHRWSCLCSMCLLHNNVMISEISCPTVLSTHRGNSPTPAVLQHNPLCAGERGSP